MNHNTFDPTSSSLFKIYEEFVSYVCRNRECEVPSIRPRDDVLLNKLSMTAVATHCLCCTGRDTIEDENLDEGTAAAKS